MNIFERALLAGAVALLAAMSAGPADASWKTCGKVLGQCQSACAKRPIGQDVCYKKCERAFMNCD